MKLSLLALPLALFSTASAHPVDCDDEKWQVLADRIEKTGPPLIRSTTAVVDYLADNPMLWDKQILRLVRIVDKLGQHMNEGWEAASENDREEVVKCSAFDKISGMFHEEEGPIHALKNDVGRRLLIGTIKEASPQGHMQNRLRKVNELNQLLKIALWDAVRVARTFDTPEIQGIYDAHWTDEGIEECVLCDRIACKLCTVIGILSRRLPNQPIGTPCMMKKSSWYHCKKLGKKRKKQGMRVKPCPRDLYTCKDGTNLVREGPNCEFPKCPPKDPKEKTEMEPEPMPPMETEPSPMEP